MPTPSAPTPTAQPPSLRPAPASPPRGRRAAPAWDLEGDGPTRRPITPPPPRLPSFPPPADRPLRGTPLPAFRASDMVKKELEWLWKPYLQGRTLNLLTGDPGIGKSTLICELAAAESRGRPLPAGTSGPSLARPAGAAWILNSEDGGEDTILWRLENQGADLTRVFITDSLSPLDRGTLTYMRDFIHLHGITLLTVDPMQAWMGADVDMHRANETRAWGGLLKQLCLETGVTVILLRHRRKGQPGENQLYSGIGSIDITGFARSELSVSKDKAGICYLHRTKGNVGVTGGTVGYVIEPHPDPRNDHGVLRWLPNYIPSEGKGGEGGPKREGKVPTKSPRRLAEAQNWLRGFLRDGPKPANVVIASAIEHRFMPGTLRAAKKGTVQSEKGPDGAWYWSLDPSVADEEPL